MQTTHENSAYSWVNDLTDRELLSEIRVQPQNTHCADCLRLSDVLSSAAQARGLLRTVA